MAKELPYFKFEPAEWLAGRITLEHYEIQGAYISICCVYWQKLGDVKSKDVRLRLGKKIYDLLIEKEFITLDGDFICIGFLDSQIDERQAISEKRSKAGAKGGKANAKQDEANAKQKRREEKKREEKREDKIPTFEVFKEYALKKKPNVNIQSLKLKYEAWIENDWKAGKDNRKIKNWKSTLLNTLQYLKEDEQKQTFDYDKW